MIQIEYLIAGLRVDVINNKIFTDEQKKELFEILDTCPTIPMTINPLKLTAAGNMVTSHLNVYEALYINYGGNINNLLAIRDDYKRKIVSALKGFKRGKMI